MENRTVHVGKVPIGGGHPIVVQTMCNTHTNDVEGTVAQCIRMAEAGAELIRITVPGLPEVEPLREIRNTFAAVAQDFTVPVFSAVTVDGDTLFVNAYAVENGSLNRVDFFALRKDSVSFLLGDADMDGEVTPEDARLTLRIAVGLDTVTPITKAAADMDGDVYVSPEDARLVLRTSVGLEQPPRTVSRFVYEIAAYKDA